jgi:hypothetical protein
LNIRDRACPLRSTWTWRHNDLRQKHLPTLTALDRWP